MQIVARSSSRTTGWDAAKLFLGVAVSLGSVALLVWNIEWQAVASSLTGANYWWLLASLGALLLAVWFKVLRWQALLLPLGRVSRANTLYAICVGYLVNTVLPGRLGELARVYLLARLEALAPLAVLSTVAADRILDVVVLALLLASVLPTADLPSWVAQSGVLVGAGGLGLLGLCLALAYPGGQGLLLRLLSALPEVPGKALVQGWAGSLVLGMEGLRGTRAQVRIGALSVAIWVVSLFIFYFAFLAFHIEVPFWAAVMVATVTNLGMVVPSSPGYVGVFHYLVVVSLGVYGVGRETALGYAVVIHVAEILPLSLMGVYSLWRTGSSLMGWREMAPVGEAERSVP